MPPLTLMLWIVIAVLAALLLWVLVVAKIIRRCFKFPAPEFVTRVISGRWRKTLQPPSLLADRMNLSPGMVVLEIGPGSGTFTFEVAERVKRRGYVVAADIQRSVVRSLMKLCRQIGSDNIEPIVCDAYDLCLKNHAVDRVFAVTCLAEIPDHIRVLRESTRILKPDGLVSLAEFFPDPDYPLRRTEISWAEDAGLKLDSKYGSWFSYQLNFKVSRSRSIL